MSAWHHYFVSWNTDNITSYFPANPAFFSCLFRDFAEQPKYLLTVVQNKITNSMWWFGMEFCHDKSCFCWWYFIYTRHNINHINHVYASECIWLHASARPCKTTHCFASAVEHWYHTLTVKITGFVLLGYIWKEIERLCPKQTTKTDQQNMRQNLQENWKRIPLAVISLIMDLIFTIVFSSCINTYPVLKTKAQEFSKERFIIMNMLFHLKIF